MLQRLDVSYLCREIPGLPLQGHFGNGSSRNRLEDRSGNDAAYTNHRQY